MSNKVSNTTRKLMSTTPPVKAKRQRKTPCPNCGHKVLPDTACPSCTHMAAVSSGIRVMSQAPVSGPMVEGIALADCVTVCAAPTPPPVLAVKEPVSAPVAPAKAPEAVQTEEPKTQADKLGELKPGKTALLWHKIGKAKPTVVLYVGKDVRGNVLIHETVNAEGKVRLMAVPAWLLTRKGK